MINTFKKTVLLSLFFYLPFTTMAWGVLGHRITAQIAESYLTPAAKAAITKILGTETMAMASNWGDFIKSDTTFKYLSPWHYVDIDSGLTKAQVDLFLNGDTAVDAYTKINFLVKGLKDKKTTAANKLFYLRMLIHIAGDIHQPMHVGHPADEGGNKIKVSWFGTFSNLHRVWDEQLINFQQLSYTEYAMVINHTTPAQKKAWLKEPVKTWIYQTYQEAQKVYIDITPEEKLSYEYNFKFVEVLNTQLLKGGVHLAGLLNEIFG